MWNLYTNKIDQILNNNPDRNSESVLNELLMNQEDLVSEIKRSNPKLLDFFRDNQKIVMKLVEYISVESDDLSNVDRGFKYPLVSSDVFDSSPPCIMTQFFVEVKDDNLSSVSKAKKIINCQSIQPNSGDQDDDCCDGDTSRDISVADANESANKNNNTPSKNISDNNINSEDQKEESVKKSASSQKMKKQKVFALPIMNKLFEFLEPLTHINEVLAGYWSKVVLNLIQMKPQEMIEYILTSNGVLDNLFRHINNQSIASVVQTLLILESNKFSSQTQEFLKDFTDIKVRAIGEFIKKFDEYSSEEIQNLSSIFSEIVSKYYLIQDGKEMLEYLCNEESVEQIFNYMKDGSDGSKNGAGQIIQSLAQYYAFNANSFISGYPEGSEYYLIMLSQYENMPFLKTLLHNFDVFSSILSLNNDNPANSSGRQTLGVHRLKIIEIMNQVIRIQFPSVQEGLVNSNILQRLLDLFFKFEWHNILHQIVMNIILFIIQNSDKPRIKAYLKHLLVDQNMTKQFIDQVGDTHFYFDKVKYPSKTTTKGYLGYVIKIADELEKFYNDSIKNRTNSDMLEWHNDNWTQFIENTLDNHKEKGCKDLGNFDKFINGISTPETAAGEDDMAIYREYERQQASDRMKQRQSYLEQVELQKFYENKRNRLNSSDNSHDDINNSEIILDYTPGIESKIAAQNNNNSSSPATIIQGITPNGDAPMTGVSSLRGSTDSLQAQKQNVMFVQMVGKQLDDDQNMDDGEEYDEDQIKKNQPDALKKEQKDQEQQQENNLGNKPLGGENIIPKQIPTLPTLPSNNTILTYNSYISDNPLIREIMEKYSPTKGLLINTDGGLVPPIQPIQNYVPVFNEEGQLLLQQQDTIIEERPSLIQVKPVIQETETEIVYEKKIILDPVIEEKQGEDETNITPIQQEGQVSLPLITHEKVEQVIQDQSTNDDSQKEQVNDQIVNQESQNKIETELNNTSPDTDKAIIVDNSNENQADPHHLNSEKINQSEEELKDNTNLKKDEIQQVEEVEQQQKNNNDNLTAEIEDKQNIPAASEQKLEENKINQQSEEQDHGIVENNPIADSPEKPENICETHDDENHNDIEDGDNINKNKINIEVKESGRLSERQNYFMSNNNEIQEQQQVSQKTQKKTNSSSLSPISHKKDNPITSPSKKITSSPCIVPILHENNRIIDENGQINKSQEVHTENEDKQESDSSEPIQLIIENEEESDDNEEQDNIKQQEQNNNTEELQKQDQDQIPQQVQVDEIKHEDNVQKVEMVDEALKNEADKVNDNEIHEIKIETTPEDIKIQDKPQEQTIQIEQQLEEIKIAEQTNTVVVESNNTVIKNNENNIIEPNQYLQESGIEEYKYVLIKKDDIETRNSPLIDQFEHNVSHKMVSLFTSQEVSKNDQLNKGLNNEYSSNLTHSEINKSTQPNFEDNVIKVDKADFKTFVFEEEPSNFEPINIELDREYDKEENEQIQKNGQSQQQDNSNSNNNINTTNNKIEQLSSLSNFKYEMKYTVPPTSQSQAAVVENNNNTPLSSSSPQEKEYKPKTIENNDSPMSQQSPTSIQYLDKIEPKISQYEQIKKVEEKQGNQESIPTLTYEDEDPSIKGNNKKIENTENNQSKSLNFDSLRRSDDMSSSLNLGKADSQNNNKAFGSSPMKFKHQFQENLRASYDSTSIQRIINSSSNRNSLDNNNNQQNSSELKLTSTQSADNTKSIENLSPNSQKVKFLQQSQQERMQIQQLLLQKYGSKNNSDTDSPQSANTEITPIDPYANPSQAHQQYSYKLKSPYEHHQINQAQTSQNDIKQNTEGAQTLTIGGKNFTIISKTAPTHHASSSFSQNKIQPQPVQQQPQEIQQQPQQQQQVQSEGMSQAERMSYVEQETILVQQKLNQSRDYQLIQISIKDMQDVYNIISDDNTVLIEERIITSQNIRQNFFEICEKNRLQLEQTIDGLELDKQRQEQELKLQYQTEFEMIEKQIRQEQDQTKAKKKTQDFLQKLLLDRVSKLYQIHLKYSQLQKACLEKSIIEAKNLNEKLLSMHLLVAPANKLSPEKANQILNPPNGIIPIIQPQGSIPQQNINLQSQQQKQNPVISQQQQQQPLIESKPVVQPQNEIKTENTNDDLNQYLINNNQFQRQYNSVPTNLNSNNNVNQSSKPEEQDSIKRGFNQPLQVEIVKGNNNSNTEDTNSPCFGKDPIRIPLHRPSEDSNSSDDQKYLMQSQGAEASPCFGNRKSPQRKSSFSQRYSSRKMSGNSNANNNQNGEGEQAQEFPYDYKASSSARDKSPMPNQAAMYNSNSSNAQSSSVNQNSTSDYMRRLTSNTTLHNNQQMPYRLSNPQAINQVQQQYPVAQNPSAQLILQQQQQQQQLLLQQQQQGQNQQYRAYDNYQPINPYQLNEDMNSSINSNSSNPQNRNSMYDSQGQIIPSQTLPQDQYQSQNQQRIPQHPQYRKIFSQTPIQSIHKSHPQGQVQQTSNPQYASINLSQQSQQPQQQQQLQQQQQSQQYIGQQQQQLNPNQPSQQQQQQQTYLNYNYSTPQPQKQAQQPIQQQQQMKQQEDQYQKISENLKLSAYYQNQPQVKTIQIDLSSNDERKKSDYEKSTSNNNNLKIQQQQQDQSLRPNQNTPIYTSQKLQASSSFHTPSNSYGQGVVNESHEIENQLQFRNYIPNQTKSSQNTPGASNTPIGSSSNLNYSGQLSTPQQLQQQQQQSKESTHKLMSQTLLFDTHSNVRNRPLSHSDIMYKPHPSQQQQQVSESQFSKLSSPYSSSPQAPSPAVSNFSQQSSQQQLTPSNYQSQQPQQLSSQYGFNVQKNNLLNPDVQQIIYKYTSGNASVGFSNYPQPQQQQKLPPQPQLQQQSSYSQQQIPISPYSQQQQQQQQQQYMSEKNNSFVDEYNSINNNQDKNLKNSSTNYSSMSGGNNSSIYNNTQNNINNNDTSSYQGFDDELQSVNSSTISSQNIEGQSQGKRIKIVMKKNQPTKIPSMTEQNEYMRQQQQMIQASNQHQHDPNANTSQSMLNSSSSSSNIKYRQIQEKDKPFLQMFNKSQPKNN